MASSPLNVTVSCDRNSGNPVVGRLVFPGLHYLRSEACWLKNLNPMFYYQPFKPGRNTPTGPVAPKEQSSFDVGVPSPAGAHYYPITQLYDDLWLVLSVACLNYIALWGYRADFYPMLTGGACVLAAVLVLAVIIVRSNMRSGRVMMIDSDARSRAIVKEMYGSSVSRKMWAFVETMQCDSLVLLAGVNYVILTVFHDSAIAWGLLSILGPAAAFFPSVHRMLGEYFSIRNRVPRDVHTTRIALLAMYREYPEVHETIRKRATMSTPPPEHTLIWEVQLEALADRLQEKTKK